MATNNWTNGGSGDWTTGSNWSTGSEPGAPDDVVIGEGQADVTSNVGTVASVEDSSTLSFNTGGTLSVTGSFVQSAGTLSVDYYNNGTGGSSLTIGGALTNSGTIDLGSGGNLSVSDEIKAASLDNTNGTINI